MNPTPRMQVWAAPIRPGLAPPLSRSPDHLFQKRISGRSGAIRSRLAWSAFAAAIALPMLTGPPAALAQSMNFTLEGKITRVSPGKLTVSSEGNIIFRVSFDDKTEIKRQDGSKGSAKDLRVGVKVRIEGDLTEAGEVVAQKIELEENSTPEKHSTGADEARPPARPAFELQGFPYIWRMDSGPEVTDQVPL